MGEGVKVPRSLPKQPQKAIRYTKSSAQKRTDRDEPLRSQKVGIMSKSPAQKPSDNEPKGDRLQKILAQAGIASRRKAEEIILEGRVQVNGTVVNTLGTRHDATRDHIRVDGKLLHGPEQQRYYMLNKPRGYVTTLNDPQKRPTVMQLMTAEARPARRPGPPVPHRPPRLPQRRPAPDDQRRRARQLPLQGLRRRREDLPGQSRPVSPPTPPSTRSAAAS